MAKEAAALKQAIQQQKLAVKDTRAAKEEREMRHIEKLLGFPTREEEAERLGFVSSPATSKAKTAKA